jgi:hypothetical protein
MRATQLCVAEWEAQRSAASEDGGKAGSLEMRSCLRGCNVWGRKRTSTSTKVNATAERRSATWSGRSDANQKNWCDANRIITLTPLALVVHRPHRTGLRTACDCQLCFRLRRESIVAPFAVHPSVIIAPLVSVTRGFQKLRSPEGMGVTILRAAWPALPV